MPWKRLHGWILSFELLMNANSLMSLTYPNTDKSKALAKKLGKTVAVGLLAFGPVDPNQK
jgi:hypothetical protein